MIDVRRRLHLPSGTSRTNYSLPMLEKTGIAKLYRHFQALLVREGIELSWPSLGPL